jgi:hypothetical protein
VAGGGTNAEQASVFLHENSPHTQHSYLKIWSLFVPLIQMLEQDQEKKYPTRTELDQKK